MPYIDLESTVKAAKKFLKDREKKATRFQPKKRIYYTSPINKDTFKPTKKKVNTGEFISGKGKPRTKLTAKERKAADKFWAEQNREKQEWEKKEEGWKIKEKKKKKKK